MKRPINLIGIGAGFVFLAVFVYAFSYPFVVDIALRYRQQHYFPDIVKFYSPAGKIATYCPPYVAILQWEGTLLGNPSQLSVPPPDPR